MRELLSSVHYQENSTCVVTCAGIVKDIIIIIIILVKDKDRDVSMYIRMPTYACIYA